MTEPGLIFAMQPDYGFGHRQSHRMFWTGMLKPGSAKYQGKVFSDQIPVSFTAGNILLATVLNALEDGKNITHIAMLHNDVVPEIGWLEMLMDELLATDADLLSVVLPIKDLNGLSSTALDSEDDPFNVERRLTMTEVHRLPETFGNADCGYPHRPLLVNTGCFVMDVTKSWFRSENPDGTLRLRFTSPDRIARRPDRQWEAQHSPSDWGFSRDVTAAGGKVLATRKVRALHMGELPYTNQQSWGDWETDQALAHRFGGKPITGGSRNGDGVHTGEQAGKSSRRAARQARAAS